MIKYLSVVLLISFSVLAEPIPLGCFAPLKVVLETETTVYFCKTKVGQVSYDCAKKSD